MHASRLIQRLRTRRPWRTVALVVGTVAITMVGAPLADAASIDTEPSYAGCLKTSGTGAGTAVAIVPGTTPRRACVSGEQAIRLSGGDITSVAAGTGLRAVSDTLGISDAQGGARLDIAPGFRLPQGCTTGQQPAKDGATWKCTTPPAPLPGPVVGYATGAGGSNPDSDGTIGNAWSVLKGMDLPAGSWAVTAKVDLKKAVDNDTGELFAFCRLDFTDHPHIDGTHIYLDGANEFNHASTAVTLVGAASRTTPFRVAVLCEDWDNDMVWSSLRIMAVPASSAPTYVGL